MGTRLQLQSLLEDLLGSRNVYFQPPETVKLKFPCIIYGRGNLGVVQFADDKPYHNRVRYEVKVVDPNPDSPILEKIASLPMCSFERHYTINNLNHDIYNLYY
jgi:hypothetical protein